MPNAISTARKRAESTLGQKEVAVQQVEKRLKVQQDQLKERKEDLENMIVKAPSPGLVVYGDPHEPWYRERTKVGGQIYGGFTLLTIPDLRVMQVKLQIHEADISKIRRSVCRQRSRPTAIRDSCCTAKYRRSPPWPGGRATGAASPRCASSTSR